MVRLFTSLLLCTVASAQAVLPETPKPLSKTFILTHSILVGSIVYDAEMTHQGLAHHNCIERNGGNPYPSRGDLYKKGVVYFVGLTAADLGLKMLMERLRAPRWLAEASGSMFAVGDTVAHVHAGAGWVGCW